jgi:hypothetical protein
MKLSIDHDFDQGGINLFSQWEYDKELAAAGKFEPLTLCHIPIVKTN